MKAKQLTDVFTHNNVVAVFHYNDLSTQEWNILRFNLHRFNCHIKVFPNKVSVRILEGTKYKHITPLFSGCTAVAYSKDVLALPNLLSCTKTADKLKLLGGIIENHLVTSDTMVNLAMQPSLTLMQKEMVTSLEFFLTGLCGALSHGTQTLIRYIPHH